MIKSYIFCVIISIIISFILAATPDETCKTQSNTTCESCLNISGCAYCKDKKICFLRPLIPTDAPCGASDLQVDTCFANALILIIGLSSAGVVLLIIIIVLVCCLRSKCRARSLRKLQKREHLDERQMEERRAAAEIRSAERNEKNDQIRMKWGIPKGKDSAVEYKRMS